MMRIWLVVMLAVGCDSGKPVAGSGSAAAPVCSFDGTYRLRFHSNGADGWWLFLTVKDSAVQITGGQPEMIGLGWGKVAATLDPTRCTIVLASQTPRAGDMKLTLVPTSDGTVSGNITRTDAYGVANEPNTPVKGRRESAPQVTPACLKVGVYKLETDPKTTWKLDGTPRVPMGCKEAAPINSVSYVRVSVLGPELYVDEVAPGQPWDQRFGRGIVTRDGDCAITLAFDKEDVRFTNAKLVFDGGVVTGTAGTMSYDFFENGEAGENHWKCSSTQVKLAGTRVAD